jgi:hypothetical protein
MPEMPVQDGAHVAAPRIWQFLSISPPYERPLCKNMPRFNVTCLVHPAVQIAARKFTIPGIQETG